MRLSVHGSFLASHPARILGLLVALLSISFPIAESFFFYNVPSFEASPTVQRERNATQHCSESWAELVQPYQTLEKVFVMDWNSLGLRGLGDQWSGEVSVLLAAGKAGRAAFTQRNAPGACSSATALKSNSTSHCRFNAALFLGGADGWGSARGFSWDWSRRTAEVVASHFRSRGVHETVFYLARTPTGGFVAPAAAEGRAASIVIEGRLSLTQLLAHPQVRDLPWVRLVFGAPGEAPQPSIEAIEEDDWATLVGLSAGNEVHRRLEPGCATSFFMRPTPRLQHRLQTGGPLPEMDAAHAAGRGVAALHVRTGYADAVGSAGASQHELLSVFRPLDAATAAQPELALSGPSLNAAEAWRLLDGLVVRCTAQHSNVTTLPGCFDWPEETQQYIDSAGAACGKTLGGSALDGLALSGSPAGFFSTLMRCAAAAAADHSSQSSPPAVYVAGDLPALHALVAHDSALRGSAFAAQAGSVGHVSSTMQCSTAAGATGCLRGRDPGGAWTRTMVDAYMISVCDVVVSHGQSVFVSGFVAYRVPRPLRRLQVTASHRMVNGGTILYIPPLLHAQSDAITARLVSSL